MQQKNFSLSFVSLAPSQSYSRFYAVINTVSLSFKLHHYSLYRENKINLQLYTVLCKSFVRDANGEIEL